MQLSKTFKASKINQVLLLALCPRKPQDKEQLQREGLHRLTTERQRKYRFLVFITSSSQSQAHETPRQTVCPRQTWHPQIQPLRATVNIWVKESLNQDEKKRGIIVLRIKTITLQHCRSVNPNML